MNMDHYSQQITVSMGSEPADLVLKHARYLNVFTGEFLQGDIAISQGRIAGIGTYQGRQEVDLSGKTVVPGFLDGHIHLESTTVTPAVFAREALTHGTTCVVTDPHEITNVCGTDGVDFMLESTADLPLDVFFMMPSCVPSCPFDESGAVIDSETTARYLQHPRILGLAEMMNAPGVIYRDPETIAKTYSTLEAGKIIDGHAPGLSGNSLQAYVGAGIYSDHECTTVKEAVEKLRTGQWIMIREGTASKNLRALLPLCKEPYADRCMFCTDDRHIDDMMDSGYIDYILREAIAAGTDEATAYSMASFHTASYFGLTGHGAIAPGYLADLVILDDPHTVAIHSVYKSGILMTPDYLDQHCSTPQTDSYRTLFDKVTGTVHLGELTTADFALKRTPEKVIGLIPGQLITTDEGFASATDVSQDILKMCVLERHKQTGHIGVCFLKGYGLKEGAIATSVAHDSHNIIVVGTNDDDILTAVQAIDRCQGGMVVVNHGKVLATYELPVAGLMSTECAAIAKEKLHQIHEAAYGLGVNPDIDPFMTLSFTSLPVIPTLKLTTLGVVDVDKFEII